jgi:hypothetical protein
VLQFYDSDKRFPAWGFGARPIDGPVSHCFNLNGSNNHCEVKYLEIIHLPLLPQQPNVPSYNARVLRAFLSSRLMVSREL